MIGIMRKPVKWAFGRGWPPASALVILLLVLQAVLACAQTTSAPRHQVTELNFTPDQTRKILSLGPWPAPWKPDTSNRVSGHPDAIALGRGLFFDARLSGQGTHSCSSCHRPEMAWQDGKRVGEGLAPGRRNTPSLLNVRYRRWFGWDGANDSLWAQSIRPILDPREMGATAEHVRAYMTSNAALAEAYLGLFNRTAAATAAEDVLVDAAKALAAYQETLVSPRTSFDDFRDALVRGDSEGMNRYPRAAQRGLELFVGQGRCLSCHGGETFGLDLFHATAPSSGLGTAPLDLGRSEGVRLLFASPYNLRSRFDDSGARAPFWNRRGTDISRSGTGKGSFRVPGLRAVKTTAPYMHDGSSAALAEAVSHPLPVTRFWTRSRRPLTATEIADLVAFLETVSLP